MDQRFLSDRFPRSSQYHPDWIAASVSGGANSLWLTEWLAESLKLQPGMRVLDLGCGRAASSTFLRREFGVEVWATDLWFGATENAQRIRDSGVADGVFPIHADARSLPFADEFFDAIVSIDSFFYFGTDDHYLGYLARFVKPGGPIGLAMAGLTREIDDPMPEHLQAWWNQDQPWCLHSAPWWRRHWERTGFVEISVADAMQGGWQHWLAWQREIAPGNSVEIQALEADRGQLMTYVRVVAHRRPGIALPDAVISIPGEYTKYTPMPLLRSPELAV